MPARAGIGLRACHHRQILERSPGIAWLEVHSENYFADGGAHIEALTAIRARYALSLHGVGLSLGSTDPLDATHLSNLKRAIARFEPQLVSEHLSFSSVEGRFTNDLLPLPYTEEALRHVSERIRAVQSELGREILIENVSSYIAYRDSALREWEFLAGVAAESQCAILLDINNIYVSAHNHGFDPHTYLEAIPVHAVREMHLAGHERLESEGAALLIDTHGAHVAEPVWALYAEALERFGPVPTLIEWDTDIPALEVLEAEAARADKHLAPRRAHASAA
jgi:uncharacterized protein (UPF0276 family)